MPKHKGITHRLQDLSEHRSINQSINQSINMYMSNFTLICHKCTKCMDKSLNVGHMEA